MGQKPGLRAKLRLGFFVFGALVTLDVVKYIVGVSVKSGSWPYMAIFAVTAASTILYFFMHISHLWRPRE